MEGKYETAEVVDFPLPPLHTSKFPQVNQTNRCWTMFVLSNIAKRKFGDDHVEARKHRFYAETLCPKFWVRTPSVSAPFSPELARFIP